MPKKKRLTPKTEIRTALQALLDKQYTDDEGTLTGAEKVALALYNQASNEDSPNWSKAIDIVTRMTYISPKEQLEIDAKRYELSRRVSNTGIFDLYEDELSVDVKDDIRQKLLQ